MKILAKTDRSIQNAFDKKEEKIVEKRKKSERKIAAQKIKKYSFFSEISMLVAGATCSVLVWSMVQDNTLLSLVSLSVMIAALIVGGLCQMIVENYADLLISERKHDR